MPEGHTLHRLAGELQELVGKRVATSSEKASSVWPSIVMVLLS